MNIKNIMNEIIEDNPIAQPVTMATYWKYNDIKYYLKKNEVYYKRDEIDENILMAQWFTKVTGRAIQIQPIVVNPQYIKTCDFILIDDNTKLELKSIKLSAEEFHQHKNYINKSLGNGYGQANHFIIDITECPYDVEKAIEDLELAMSYANRKYVHRVYLKKNDELIGVFERK